MKVIDEICCHEEKKMKMKSIGDALILQELILAAMVTCGLCIGCAPLSCKIHVVLIKIFHGMVYWVIIMVSEYL